MMDAAAPCHPTEGDMRGMTWMGEPMTEREQLIYVTAWSDGVLATQPMTAMELRVGYERPNWAGRPWLFRTRQPVYCPAREKGQGDG